MKQGAENLTAWAQRIESNAAAKRDFAVAGNAASMVLQPAEVVDDEPGRPPVFMDLGVPNVAPMPMNEIAHDQAAGRLQLPRAYYQRMLEQAPELLATNVNHWLHSEGKHFLVRTLHDQVRAWLSPSYRRLDNEDVVRFLGPTIEALGSDLEMFSCEVTERRLYLKVGIKSLALEVKRGDFVQAGVVFQNSEVGLGSLSVRPFLNRLVCTNGMVVDDLKGKLATSRRHVGRRLAIESGMAFEVEYSDETQRTDDRAVMLKLRDTVQHILSPDGFQAVVDKLRAAVDTPEIEAPTASVELARKEFGLTEAEGETVLRHLAKGGDLTAWGFANAVTRAASDAGSYDRATELERAGYSVIDAAQGDAATWRRIARAKPVN